jgi:hypothetical protein
MINDTMSRCGVDRLDEVFHYLRVYKCKLNGLLGVVEIVLSSKMQNNYF